MRKIVPILFLALFLSGCFEPILPTKISLDVVSDYDVVFNKVVMTLQDLGFVLSMADKGSGLINSDYRDRGQIYAVLALCYYRDKINVFVKKNEGSNLVNIFITLINEAKVYSGQKYGEPQWSMTETNAKELNDISQKIKEKF